MHEDADWLVHDHRKYDEALAQCELAAGAGDWDEAVPLFRDFVEDFELHMRMEDEVVYPLYLQLGDQAGEIDALRDEHDDIVRLLRDLVYVIKRRDDDHFLESLRPLRRAMFRHNRHEEVVLGARAEAVLLHRAEIVSRLRDMNRAAGREIWEV